jgi:hypothetical protein
VGQMHGAAGVGGARSHSAAAHVESTLVGAWALLRDADEAAAAAAAAAESVTDRSCAGGSAARRHGQLCVDSSRLQAVKDAATPQLQLPPLTRPAAELLPSLSANDVRRYLEQLHKAEIPEHNPSEGDTVSSASALLRAALGSEANLALLCSVELRWTTVCALGGALLRERDLIRTAAPAADRVAAADCSAVLQALLQEPATVVSWLGCCPEADSEFEPALHILAELGLTSITAWPTQFDRIILHALHVLLSESGGVAGNQWWGSILRHVLTAGKPFDLEKLRWLVGTSPLHIDDVVRVQSSIEASDTAALGSVEDGECGNDARIATQHHLGVATIGQPVWCDRLRWGPDGKRPTIASLSDGLAGGIVVRGASRNKWNATQHLQLRLKQPCNVYVCFDSRASGAWVSGATRSLPSWCGVRCVLFGGRFD